jgi:hypothetical protein
VIEEKLFNSETLYIRDEFGKLLMIIDYSNGNLTIEIKEAPFFISGEELEKLFLYLKRAYEEGKLLP